MKTLICILTSAVILFSTGAPQAADIKVRTGVNYDWWDDNKDNKASQIYLPIRIESRHQQFSVSVLTGYASTHINQSGEESRSLNHLLDTKINTSYEISGNLPVDLLVGLDVNLPTGKTALKEADNEGELDFFMDPDLISISKFGEGYNLNPTLVVSKEVGNWVGGVGLGYAMRGSYDYSETTKDYNPGDIFNSTAEIRYSFPSHLTSRFFGNVAFYGEDKVDGKDVYREGNLLLLGIGLHFAKTKWDGDITMISIFRGNGEGLIIETNESHGDEWIGDISLRYLLNDKITLKSSLQGRWISEPDREKFSMRLGASKIFMPNLDGEVMVKGFVMHDGERRFPEERSERDYQGGSLEVVLTTRF